MLPLQQFQSHSQFFNLSLQICQSGFFFLDHRPAIHIHERCWGPSGWCCLGLVRFGRKWQQIF